jgi:hypothetical protein
MSLPQFERSPRPRVHRVRHPSDTDDRRIGDFGRRPSPPGVNPVLGFGSDFWRAIAPDQAQACAVQPVAASADTTRQRRGIWL